MVQRRRLTFGSAPPDLDDISPHGLEDACAVRAQELQEEQARLKKQDELEKQGSNLQGEQLSAYIQTCVKLSQDNKITIKNAFDFQLIDYMIPLANEKDGNSTNFSLASMTLDASGKIYAYRVDAVHQDAFRLAFGFAGGKSDAEGGLHDAYEALNHENTGLKSSKKRKIRSTYITEEATISGNIEIDYEMSTNEILTLVHHNEGNALGRIMSYNILPFENESVDLEGKNAWWECNSRFESVTCNAERNLFPGKVVLSTYLEGKNMEERLAMESLRKGDCLTVRSNGDKFGHDEDSLNSSVAFDPDAEPLPLSEGQSLIAPSNGQAIIGNDQGGDMMFGDVGSSFLSSFLSRDGTAASVCSDFSFSFVEQLKSVGLNFAGPSLFKLKRYNIFGVEKRPLTGINLPSEKRRCAPRPELAYVSFNDDSTQERFIEVKADVTASSKRQGHTGYSVNTLKASTMERWTSGATTLTVDFAASSFDRLIQLSLLPAVSVRKSKRKPTEDLGDDRLIDYKDDIDNQPVSPCADDHFSEVRDGEHIERDFNIENVEAVDEDFGVFASQPENAEDVLVDYNNLISAQGVVAEKLVIAYTKAAKKFNVRQLKESYWKILTNMATKADIMQDEKLFSKLYLEVQPLLSNTNRRNISLSIAFVTSLLLCNEKHLVLRADGECDFFIAQAPNPYNDVSLESNRYPGNKK